VHSRENVVERSGRVSASFTSGDPAITRQLRTDVEESRFGNKLSVETEVYVVSGATEIFEKLSIHFVTFKRQPIWR